MRDTVAKLIDSRLLATEQHTKERENNPRFWEGEDYEGPLVLVPF
jgi:hypothetical protein